MISFVEFKTIVENAIAENKDIVLTQEQAKALVENTDVLVDAYVDIISRLLTKVWKNNELEIS